MNGVEGYEPIEVSIDMTPDCELARRTRATWDGKQVGNGRYVHCINHKGRTYVCVADPHLDRGDVERWVRSYVKRRGNDPDRHRHEPTPEPELLPEISSEPEPEPVLADPGDFPDDFGIEF